MKAQKLPFGKALALMMLLFFFISIETSGQLNYLSTIPPFNGGNGSSLITFNVKAEKPIRIREMYCSFSSTTTQTTIIWYKTDSINGSPSVSTATGWIQAHQYYHTPATSGNGTMVIISDTSLNIEIPAGATYGFAISGSSVRYSGTGSTPLTPYLIADSNIYINTGPNVGYGGTLTSTIAYRHYNGQIGYELIPQETDAGLQALQSPGDTSCSGVQPVTVVLENLGPSPLQNVDIHWSVNGVSQTTHNWAGNLAVNATTTATIGQFNFNTGTTYNITAYTSNPNNVLDTVNTNDTIVKTGIQVKPSPVATPADTVIDICGGDTVHLTFTLAGTPPWSLIIDDGTTAFPFNQITGSAFTASFTPATSRTYRLHSLTDATGCVNLSEPTIDVFVFPQPPAIITPVTTTAACAGDSVALMASVGLNFLYQWKKDNVDIPGATSYVYQAKESGAYTVVVISPIGCSNTSDPTNVTIHPLPLVFLGNDTAVLPGTSLLLDAGPGFNSYQWNTGANSQTIVVDSSGVGIGVKTIFVHVTDNYYCLGGDTININFTNHPGINEAFANAGMQVIPNPSDGRIELLLENIPAGSYEVELFSPDGKLIYRSKHQLNNNRINLDLRHVANGVYLLKLTGGGGAVAERVLIQR